MKFIYENGEMVLAKPKPKGKLRFKNKRNSVLLTSLLIGALLFTFFLLDGGFTVLAFKFYSFLDHLGLSTFFQHAFNVSSPTAF